MMSMRSIPEKAADMPTQSRERGTHL